MSPAEMTVGPNFSQIKYISVLPIQPYLIWEQFGPTVISAGLIIITGSTIYIPTANGLPPYSYPYEIDFGFTYQLHHSRKYQIQISIIFGYMFFHLHTYIPQQ